MLETNYDPGMQDVRHTHVGLTHGDNIHDESLVLLIEHFAGDLII